MCITLSLQVGLTPPAAAVPDVFLPGQINTASGNSYAASDLEHAFSVQYTENTRSRWQGPWSSIVQKGNMLVYY